MAAKEKFVVVNAGSVSLDTVITDLIIATDIKTATSKGRKQFAQTLRVRIHDVTIRALLAFVLRAVVIRFQQWIRAKGDIAGELFMRNNTTYLHDISAALRSGADPAEMLKAAADPIAELNKLIEKAGLTGKVSITAPSTK